METTRAEAERVRQATLERHGREAIDLPLWELSDFINPKKKLVVHSNTISDAVAFYRDMEQVRRRNITVSQPILVDTSQANCPTSAQANAAFGDVR